MAPDTCGLRLILAGMRVVARAAPQRGTRCPFAGAFAELLHMAGHFEIATASRPREPGSVVRQALPCLECRDALTRLFNPRFAGKMTLVSYGIAQLGFEFRRVQHWRPGGIPRMLTARPMTTFARNAVFEKRRISVTVLRAEHGPDAAGVARQTTRFDGTVQTDLRVVLITGRRIPRLLFRIPGDGKFKQIAIPGGEIAAPIRGRSDKPGKGQGTGLKLQPVVFDFIPVSGGDEGCGRDGFHASARTRRACLRICIEDRGVARTACLASDQHGGQQQHASGPLRAGLNGAPRDYFRTLYNARHRIDPQQYFKPRWRLAPVLFR